MVEQNDQEEQVREPDAEAPNDAPPEPDDAKGEAGLAQARKDAARYRRELRDTQAERDALTAQLTAVRRAEIERLAADTLQAGDDIWRAEGIDVAELLDDDGRVDAEKVREAATAIVEQHPHWKRRLAFGASDAGVGISAPAKPAAGFGKALKGGRR